MKKKLSSFIVFLICLLSSPTAFSQGEWKWAHYWSGSDNPSDPNQYYNKILNTAFDSEGNIYTYGVMGGRPIYDGNEFLFTDISDVMNTNVQGVLLAKFDTLGNMLWNRVIKCSPYGGSAGWMEVHDGRIYISGSYSFWGDNPWGSWLFYLDSLVRKADLDSIPAVEQHPPFKRGDWTFFCQFDLDGNLIEDHFVEALSRELHIHGTEFIRMTTPLCYAITPIHIDHYGNTYIAGLFTYEGVEEDPYTIVIDGDSNRTYDIYLPGSCQLHYSVAYNPWYDTYDTLPYYSTLRNIIICKFSPDWELVWAKMMVDHTEGLATDEQDTVNPRWGGGIEGLSYDEEDNMYVSGYVKPSVYWDAHQYPIHFYWDSTHYATINDMSGVDRTHFVIKYDTAGNVLWSNQIYTRGTDCYPGYANDQWWRNLYYNNALYLTGHGQYHHDGHAGIFFDSTFTQQLVGPEPDVDGATIGFFVRYDAETGSFLNYGVVPAFEENSDAKPGTCPAVLNNRVFALSYYKRYLTDEALMQWRSDGHFIGYEPFLAETPNLGSLIVHDDGSVICDMQSKESVTFSNSVWASCYPTSNSSAVFAMYKDPAFATPYTGIPAHSSLGTGLRRWPNPANSLLYVTNDGLRIDYVTVLDIEGRMILRREVRDTSVSLDVSRLPAGTYLIEAAGKGQVSTGKFVKK